MATDALRNILIKLQGSLLTHLWSAQEDDNVTDFHVLVDASDFGRIQSVTVLNELYMRMAQAAPLHEMHLPIQASTADPGSIWKYEDPINSAQVLGRSPNVSLSSDRNLSLESEKNPGRLPESARRKWGMFHLRSHKLESEIASESLIPSSISKSVLRGSDSRPGENVSSERLSSRVNSENSIAPGDDAIASSPWKELSEMSIAEGNPWREEPSTSIGGGLHKPASQEMNPTTRTAHLTRRQSTEATLVEDPPRLPQKSKPMGRIAPPMPRKQLKSQSETPSKGTQKIPFMSRRRTTPNVTPSVTQPQTHDLTPSISPIISQTQTTQSALPSSRSPYGGYCKGAYKMQVGLDRESVKLRSQSVSMTGESNYWACASSKCAWEGPACKNGKQWEFDDTVRVSHAVQYRWTFLAKCHVALSKVKNGLYDYQCVFCGVQPSENVYRGENAFIEHVSKHHRGQQPDLSDKICCIYGRVALESEPFDVNLTPREDSPGVHSPISVGTPDLISGFDVHYATPEEALEWPATESLSSRNQQES